MVYYLCKLVVCVGLNFISAVRCKHKAELYLEHPYKPVYDILHANTAKITLYIPDYLLGISCLVNFMKFIIYNNVILPDTFHKNINVLIYSLFFRSITTPLTIMPTCMSKKNLSSSGLYSKIFVSTHDLIYSGHTIVFIFLGKLLAEDYTQNILFFTMGNIIQYIFPVTLILARQHYTIDVVMSFLVYNLIYHLVYKMN